MQFMIAEQQFVCSHVAHAAHPAQLVASVERVHAPPVLPPAVGVPQIPGPAVPELVPLLPDVLPLEEPLVLPLPELGLPPELEPDVLPLVDPLVELPLVEPLVLPLVEPLVLPLVEPEVLPVPLPDPLPLLVVPELPDPELLP